MPAQTKDQQIAALQDQIKALQDNVMTEHEMYLVQLRNNLDMATRNVDLSKKLTTTSQTVLDLMKARDDANAELADAKLRIVKLLDIVGRGQFFLYNGGEDVKAEIKEKVDRFNKEHPQRDAV